MKITTGNYSKAVKQIGLKNLPSELFEAHHFLKTATGNFKNWNVSGEEFHEVRKLAFGKLEELMNVNGKSLSGTDAQHIRQAKEDAKNYTNLSTDQLKRIYRLELDAEIEGDATPEESKIRRTALEKELKKRDKKWLDEFKSLSGISDTSKEVRYMEWFLSFHGKTVKRIELVEFLHELQEDIREQEIRKTSPNAKFITKIQQSIVDLVNQKRMVFKIAIAESFRDQLETAISHQKEMEKRNNDDESVKSIDLSGISTQPEGIVLSSKELERMEFKTLGFTGKWLNLMGDPCPGFTAMVFGKPKMGKSYLSVDFAGYLARNFGKVLYVAKEEKFGLTLAKKLEDKNATHENLIISESIPEDLSAYEFIFLDSINSLGLKPEDLRTLKEKNPEKSFVFVFQTTKTGNFRGENTFQHDVDIVIEIPERGMAVQFGRFNQGGEISIFEDEMRSESELEGVSSKNNKAYPAWTRPKYMDERDHRQLRHIYDLYKQGKFKQAMDYASYNCDTAIREEIPGEIWKKIGGELTPSGEARLKAKLKAKKKKENSNKDIKEKNKIKFDPESFSDRSDDENPAYLFSMTSNRVLVEALKGEFDLNYLVRRELASRGLDSTGKWVGFERAKEIHKEN